MEGSQAHYVVIGSGLAGFGMVRELRRLAPGAEITVVTRDDGHFYSKPALSTALAKGKEPQGLITMPAEKMMVTHRIDLRRNVEVIAIDRALASIRIEDELIAYDRLILATGATPVQPALSGNAAGDMLSVNSLDDYAIFRSRLRPGMHVAIIGAGLVGCEFANDLSQHDHTVTVIDPLPCPLAQLVPSPVGKALRDALAAQGVQWRLDTSVSACERAGSGYRLTLADGTSVDADLVLSAIGIRPNIELARSAGLATGKAIIVDGHGRTSDPHIFAIGDCAQYPHGLSAFVTPIMAAARAIAASATGTPTPIAFPTLSVQVKTSALPIVLLAPDSRLTGQWTLAERDQAGEKYLFRTGSGAMGGYVLTGSYCDQRMQLDREIADQDRLRDVA